MGVRTDVTELKVQKLTPSPHRHLIYDKGIFLQKRGTFYYDKRFSPPGRYKNCEHIYIYLTNICTKHTQQEKPKIYEHKIHRIQGINWQFNNNNNNCWKLFCSAFNKKNNEADNQSVCVHDIYVTHTRPVTQQFHS